MADSTIDSELIYLLPGRFGAAQWFAQPQDGFAGAAEHNVVKAARPVGTVAQVLCSGVTGQPGFAEFVYLQYEGTGAPTLAAKQVCVPDSSTLWYVFTNDPDSAIQATGCPLAVVALSAMTDAYYGWFWSGGICPEQYVAALCDNFATEDNLAAGPICAHDLAADAIGFGPIDETVATEVCIGFSLAADA